MDPPLLNDGGGDGTGCFEIEVKDQQSNLSKMVRFEEQTADVWTEKIKTFIEDKIKVANNVAGDDRAGMYLS